MRPKYGFPYVIMIVVGLSGLLGGCTSDDPSDPVNDPVVQYIWPNTADKLMVNFELAYANMDIDEYENCLHPDFRFVFTNGDIWERADDMTSTTNMFAGNLGHDSEGNPRSGVQSIEFIEMTQQLIWDTTRPDHPHFPVSDQALYKVKITFYLDGGMNTITVSSQQLFYAVALEVNQGLGTTRTRYFLCGQQDIESRKSGIETKSWGEIKTFFAEHDKTGRP